MLSNHVTQGRKTLSQHTQSCLREIRTLLVSNSPRKIEASQAEVVHIYVDASFNYSGFSGLGGMLVNMSEKVISFFSARVSTITLDDILSKGQKTVIQELEMMAVFAAFRSWKELISSNRVVLFTDSEAVRGAFLKSWSANEDSDKMVGAIFQVESDFDVPVWIESRARATPLTFCLEKLLLNLEEPKELKWIQWKCGAR